VPSASQRADQTDSIPSMEGFSGMRAAGASGDWLMGRDSTGVARAAPHVAQGRPKGAASQPRRRA